MTSSSLITKVLALLSPDTMRSAADATGETRDTMRRVIEGAIPVALAGLASKAGQGEAAPQLLELVRNGTAGTDLAALIFGAKAPGIVDALARWAGVRKEVAAYGLRAGSELSLKALADEHAKRGFTAASLGEYLAAQWASLRTFVPAPLLGGLGLLPAAAEARPETVSTLVRLAQVAGVAAVFLSTTCLYRTCGTAKVEAAAQERRVEVKLPGGGTLRLVEGAFTHNLARFLADANDKQLPRTFVFDHLNFDTAETRITPESVPTVAELVAILKAYPEVDVRLEGHTDTQGDAASNQVLSEARAQAIYSYLLTQGVAAPRMATGGFGQTRPIAGNGTEEGRARNRRLELVVVKK